VVSGLLGFVLQDKHHFKGGNNNTQSLVIVKLGEEGCKGCA
jgi:hypothetical protein